MALSETIWGDVWSLRSGTQDCIDGFASTWNFIGLILEGFRRCWSIKLSSDSTEGIKKLILKRGYEEQGYCVQSCS